MISWKIGQPSFAHKLGVLRETNIKCFEFEHNSVQTNPMKEQS